MAVDIASYVDRFNGKWVFFDFFDTLVHRRCTPCEIKRYWAKELMPALDMRMTATELYAVRSAAERLHAIKNAIKDGEIDLAAVAREVYRQLLIYFEDSGYMLPMTADEFVLKCVAVERNIEIQNQYVDQNAAKLARELYKRGKRIAIVSDFYMGRDDIYHFIQHAGLADCIERENVFVSCDYGASKRTGRLYTAVLAALGITRNDCIMLGDNKARDVKAAKEVGIKALRLPYRYNQIPKSESFMEKQLDLIAKRNSKGALRYSNCCFQLFLAIDRMYATMTVDGIKDAYFISREGQFLQKLFDAYQQQLPNYVQNRIRTHYIYASRRSVYPSRLRPLENEDFGKLKEFRTLSVKDFLTNIGFRNEEIGRLLQAYAYDIDSPVDSFFVSEAYQALLCSSVFAALYDSVRKERTACMRSYFEQCGIGGNMRIGFVDIGWSGFVQDSIKRLFPDTPMTGYYIGISCEGEQAYANRKKGMLYSPCPTPSMDYAIWSYDKNFMERVLWADHGATDYYYRDGDRCLPYIQNNAYEAEGYAKTLPLQEAIFSKLIGICKLFADSYLTAEDVYGYLLNRHINTTFLLNMEQLRLQKHLMDHQSQNFGVLASAKLNNEKVYSKKAILKKALRRLSVLKSSEAIFHICLHNKLYLPIKLLYRAKYHSVMRERRHRH